MMLSVIIPTRNRADLLKSTLQSLESQTLQRDLFEVIVVDNGSTDNTRQVVESAQQQLVNVHYFYDPTPGLHVGRHLGMKMAESNILVYADDDIEAFPTWLESIAESFQDTSIVLVGGKNLPKFEIEPPDWIMEMWKESQNGDKILYPLSIIDLGNDTKNISPFFVFGCNFAVRKSLLFEADGFHPDSFPLELIRYRGDGESHISRYIESHRYQTIYNPKASVFHSVPSQRMTEEYFCKRFFHQGISDSYSCIRSGDKFSFMKILKRVIQQHIPSLTNNSFNKRFQTCYWQGYDFHQNEVKNDSQLYNWVMKKNYL